ncbi:MAG: M24 family metallopeptidase [Candidatus Aminicenantes bacterium]|nr:M24 family metallopeptidase [Candidatus Aminicenantes bacterium]
MIKKTALAIAVFLIFWQGTSVPVFSSGDVRPAVLSIRERAELVYKITQKRLEILLPRFMRETGFDMWIITCNEDNLDPIFETMMPYENWCPITQILVMFDRGPAKGVERLNVSRTDTQGLFANAWDAAAWDAKKGESQWDCLGRIVRERAPKRIGLNEGEVQWVAGGLTKVLEQKLVEAVGPTYAPRLESAEPLATLWAETLLEEEVEIMERAAALSHAIIAEMFSNATVTPGQTTADDLRYFYWQKVADLGLKVSFSPFVSIRGRNPENREKFGKDDKVIRPGDLLHCDVGLKYMRWNSDHQEMAYVLRMSETDAPETFKKQMAEANRLQDVYCGEFKSGLSGNELLGNMLKKAREMGIPNPRIYSHSLGLFLHEPGPLIGLPWEQVNNPGRGEVKLVPMSCFTCELSVTGPVPEWGGQDFRLPLEQDVVFTGERTLFLDGRQIRFHLIK